jgi:hypothetical protein
MTEQASPPSRVRSLYLALVHYPILDRQGDLITTTITMIDVHDTSRSARTYQVREVCMIHPLETQRELVNTVRKHWVEGSGGKRIPTRTDALSLVTTSPSLADYVAHIEQQEHAAPELWVTAARANKPTISYRDGAELLTQPGPPVLLLFGTGWGLPPQILDQATFQLEPIVGMGNWNHLSVRAACAISLDRLHRL